MDLRCLNLEIVPVDKDELGPIEETVDETILKLRLASVAVPRFRSQERRRLRTESGREINTAELGEALLKRADIELAIREEVARRHCQTCGTSLKRFATVRCGPCERLYRTKHIGLSCSCGRSLSSKTVCSQRRNKGPDCTLICKICHDKQRASGYECNVCKMELSPRQAAKLRYRYGDQIALICPPCRLQSKRIHLKERT